LGAVCGIGQACLWNFPSTHAFLPEHPEEGNAQINNCRLDAVDIRLRTEGLTNLTTELGAVRPERRAA